MNLRQHDNAKPIVSSQIKHSLCYALVLIGCVACEHTIDPAELEFDGYLLCQSPKSKNVVFNSTQIRAYGTYPEPYVLVDFNGADAKLMESEAWVCAFPDGTRRPLLDAIK